MGPPRPRRPSRAPLRGAHDALRDPLGPGRWPALPLPAPPLTRSPPHSMCSPPAPLLGRERHAARARGAESPSWRTGRPTRSVSATHPEATAPFQGRRPSSARRAAGAARGGRASPAPGGRMPAQASRPAQNQHPAHRAQYLFPTPVTGSALCLLAGVFLRDSFRVAVRPSGCASSSCRPPPPLLLRSRSTL